MPEVRCVDAHGRREPKSALRGTNCAALAQRLRPREQSVAHGGRRSDPAVNPQVVRRRRSFKHRAWDLQISELPTPSTPHDSGEADPLRLSQVISNLLTNAAKYTDAGGQVTLSATLDRDELLISVKDTGIGLGPATIPGLFTMFSQVDSAIDRAEGGLGIGLALVKGLVELHGGQVSAASEGLGRGAEFLVRLPSWGPRL
jgi:signal transduction histidine kinase